MPPTPPYLNKPFEQQVAYFREKLALPAETLRGVTTEYHDWAFSVSGITRADLIADMKWLVDRAIAEGMDYDDFIQQFYRLIGRKGWTPIPIDPNASEEVQLQQKQANDSRLYTIIDTNHRRSHSAGRIRQMRGENLKKKRPYWQWLWRDSVKPRPHHQAIDRKVFRADEEFWEKCFPPCGFGCRCTVVSKSEQDLEREGLEVEAAPDWRAYVEPGFTRAAGVSPEESRQEFIEQGISRQSPTLQRTLRELLNVS